MKCVQCGDEFTPDVRCPRCGRDAPATGCRAPKEVTVRWLEELLDEMDYDAAVLPDEADAVFAAHAERADLFLNIDRDLGLIVIRTPWKMNPPGEGERFGMIEAVNRANGLTRVITFYLDADMATLVGYSHITLGELISEETVTDFFEEYDREMYYAMNTSGLLEFG